MKNGLALEVIDSNDVSGKISIIFVDYPNVEEF